VAGLVVQHLDPETAHRLSAEDGPFEIASAGLYMLAFLIAAAGCFRERPTLLRLSGTVMLFWATLRELDFQKRFTYRSVESFGYYTRPIAPWSEKIMVLLVLMPFVLAGMYLVFGFLRRTPAAWQMSSPWLSYVFGMIVLLLVSSVLEKVFRHGAAEEVCESGMALMTVFLAWETRVSKAESREAALSARQS
jgi:hypothetical protein